MVGIDSATGASHGMAPTARFEYQEVLDALMDAFPEKSLAEIHGAVADFVQGTAQGEVDPQAMVDHISKLFNREISTATAAQFKKEWEDFTRTMDVGLEELAETLESYGSQEFATDTVGRASIMLLWEKLQQELEEAVGEESKVVGDSDKILQEKKFEEYMDKRCEEIKKKKSAGIWGKFKKWLSTAAAVIGAVVASLVAAAAVATGVGAIVAGPLIVSAGIMVTLALGNVASAVADECGVDYRMGQFIGQGIAHVLGKDPEEFGKKFATGLQIALSAIAVVCSLGAGIASSLGAGAATASAAVNTGATTASAAVNTGATTASAASNSLGTLTQVLNLSSALLGIGTGAVQIGSAVSNYRLAKFQATLLELKALLEQLSETRNMDQELIASLLKKIFEAMRSNVAESMDTIVNDMKNASGFGLARA